MTAAIPQHVSQDLCKWCGNGGNAAMCGCDLNVLLQGEQHLGAARNSVGGGLKMRALSASAIALPLSW